MKAQFMTMQLSEFELIKTYFSPLSEQTEGAFNLTDDAAVLEVPVEQSLVVTTDTLVEGIHFLSEDGPKDIAAKLLRVSLSDLAAMGAMPAYYSLAIAVTPFMSVEWFKEFSQNLAADQAEFGITLIGGDTVSTSGPLTLSLTAMGFVKTGTALRRSGACIGDDIWVSGSIGDSALGLKVAKGEFDSLAAENKDYLLSRYRRPLPRTSLGQELINNVHSVIDVSDGLVADLGHICKTSDVGAKILMGKIPLSVAGKEAIAIKPRSIDLILSGGDDYELLFTADSTFQKLSKIISERTNVSLTKIGTIIKTKSVCVLDLNGKRYPVSKAGYTHF
jgi:thiamine-monophosphate kinase